MACCDAIYRTFVNEAVTTIPFSGAVPTTTVMYLIEGEWTLGVAQVVKILGGNVIVDHGGVMTGIVKIIP